MADLMDNDVESMERVPMLQPPGIATRARP